MHTEMTLSHARREAAASIKWPAKTAFLLNPDRLVRRKLDAFILFAVGLSVTCWICVGPHGAITDYVTSKENSELRPAMESEMKNGVLSAGTWLSKHFPGEYPGLLEKESDEGDPTAMFTVGRILLLLEHPEKILKVDPSLTTQQLRAKGKELIRKAVAAGNQDALMFAIRYRIE